MAVMTKAQAKKFNEMTDKMIDVLNFLKNGKVIDADEQRAVMLKGFSKLVDVLQEKKVINAKDAKAAMKGGFDSLIVSLS
jgi:hypothetical protein